MKDTREVIADGTMIDIDAANTEMKREKEKSPDFLTLCRTSRMMLDTHRVDYLRGNFNGEVAYIIYISCTAKAILRFLLRSRCFVAYLILRRNITTPPEEGIQ